AGDRLKCGHCLQSCPSIQSVMPSRRQQRRQEFRMVDIAVVGAGTMGAGIAESSALAGLSVVMLDVREEALDLGRNTIEKDLNRRVKKGRLSEEERRAS